jgi:hypothetical protein
VGAARDLRHHTAEPGVLVDAARDRVDERSRADDTDAGLVAGRLDAEDQRLIRMRGLPHQSAPHGDGVHIRPAGRR